MSTLLEMLRTIDIVLTSPQTRDSTSVGPRNAARLTAGLAFSICSNDFAASTLGNARKARRRPLPADAGDFL